MGGDNVANDVVVDAKVISVQGEAKDIIDIAKKLLVAFS